MHRTDLMSNSDAQPTALLGRIVRVGALPFSAVAGALFGRSKTLPMTRKSALTGSEGTVRVRAGNNGNTRLKVRVKHLPHASELESDATVYVVWTRSQDGTKTNVGALTLNDNLEGTLETVTPHRWFQVTLTPEPTGQVTQPTHDAVLTADVERSEGR
jgi:hypothetical protein